jgi:hypothetical protein
VLIGAVRGGVLVEPPLIENGGVIKNDFCTSDGRPSGRPGSSHTADKVMLAQMEHLCRHWNEKGIVDYMFCSVWPWQQDGLEWNDLPINSDVIDILKHGIVTLLQDPIGGETNIKYCHQFTL